MIYGMTGFGSADFVFENLRGTVEIKSVNHRYLDIIYYLPAGFAYAENKIQQMISQHVERGRITVSVKINNKPGLAVSFNVGTAKQYLKYATSLREELGIQGELSLSDLIHLPGVVETKEAMLDADALWPFVEKAIVKALKGLLIMRQREGRSLIKDIAIQTKRMLLQINRIRFSVRMILKDKKEVLAGEEFLNYQKSTDINEEISRLRHHIDEVRLLLKSQVAAGKKLDFIAQEMQREANTIGSKVQEKTVSNAVIAIKTKIEKIREQSQNIE